MSHDIAEISELSAATIDVRRERVLRIESCFFSTGHTHSFISHEMYDTSNYDACYLYSTFQTSNVERYTVCRKTVPSIFLHNS